MHPYLNLEMYFQSSRANTESMIVGYQGETCLVLEKKKKNSCLTEWLYMHPTSSEGGFLLLLALQHLILSYIWNLAELIGVVGYLMILIRDFLVVHFCMIFAICICLLDRCLFRSLPIALWGCFRILCLFWVQIVY